ncbi:hypothetical protein CICLE_v10024102mg, partial [Citrus x clementina]
ERLPDKMQIWRNALTEAANLSGSGSHEIVNAILKRLDDTFQSETNDLVGVELPMKEIESLLRSGSTNVCTLGIWGIGGIGKTTIAGAIFNKISRHSAGSYFANNVREAEETGRLGDLRQQLLSTLLNDGNVKSFPNIGLNFQSKRLTRKKVLIVFYDVNHPRQIEFLVGRLDLFASGSRIIITTRDRQLLTNCGVDEKYQMKELVHADALKLFSRHAFGGDHPYESHTELTCKTIKYARGVPLALKVWVAFFLEKRRERIDVLVDRSLITTSDDNKIEMHDLSRISKVVRQESINDLGRRSRIWHHKEIYKILSENRGTEAIQGISLDVSKVKDINLHPNTFTKTPNLRILKFYRSMNEENKCKVSYFQVPGFTEVRYLHWHKKLVLLKMPHSNIEQVFDSVQHYLKLNQIITAAFNFFSKTPTPSLTQHLNKLAILNLSGRKNLQKLNLSGCSKLKRLPEISSGNIETMRLDGTAPEELPSSIECLSKLLHLDLVDCKTLKSLPSGLGKLKSLGILSIDGCSNLQRLPEELGNLQALDSLHAVGTAITEVPPSIVRLKRVRGIYLGRNRGLSLPITFSVYGLQNLLDLSLNDCCIMELPESLGLLSSVRELHLNGNNFERIPESIIQLSNLKSLFIRYCERLQFLPKLPCNLLISYPWLQGRGFLPWNEIPKWFSFQSVGSCVTLEMPPGFFNNERLFGFAFSVILRFSEKFSFFCISKKKNLMTSGNTIAFLWQSGSILKKVMNFWIAQRKNVGSICFMPQIREKASAVTDFSPQ